MLEYDPNFNAGRGSVFTYRGIRWTRPIMTDQRAAGAVPRDRPE